MGLQVGYLFSDCARTPHSVPHSFSFPLNPLATVFSPALHLDLEVSSLGGTGHGFIVWPQKWFPFVLTSAFFLVQLFSVELRPISKGQGLRFVMFFFVSAFLLAFF